MDHGELPHIFQKKTASTTMRILNSSSNKETVIGLEKGRMFLMPQAGLGAGTDKEKDEDIDTNRDPMDLDEEDDTRQGLSRDGDGAVVVPKLKLGQ